MEFIGLGGSRGAKELIGLEKVCSHFTIMETEAQSGYFCEWRPATNSGMSAQWTFRE